MEGERRAAQKLTLSQYVQQDGDVIAYSPEQQDIRPVAHDCSWSRNKGVWMCAFASKCVHVVLWVVGMIYLQRINILRVGQELLNTPIEVRLQEVSIARQSSSFLLKKTEQLYTVRIAVLVGRSPSRRGAGCILLPPLAQGAQVKSSSMVLAGAGQPNLTATEETSPSKTWLHSGKKWTFREKKMWNGRASINCAVA